MGWFRRQLNDDLPARCEAYLRKGPPSHMDDEIREIGGIVIMESSNLDAYDDAEIRAYMQQEAELVIEVLARSGH